MPPVGRFDARNYRDEDENRHCHNQIDASNHNALALGLLLARWVEETTCHIPAGPLDQREEDA